MPNPTPDPERTARESAGPIQDVPAEGRTVDEPTNGGTQEYGTEDFDEVRAARRARKLENVKVPGYEVIAELGHGGMGVVYKARDTKLDRVVALKMILAGIHATETQLARFVREAKAVAQFQHSNIVQIYEINEADGLPYFSLEFVDGGSLHGKIDHKPQPPEFSAKTTEILARAMQYAHDRGVIHRDLKPANVLLTKDGVPKIVDFGLAKKADDSSQTQAGQAVGTPNYMAPEQARGDLEAIGPATDQFALGGILYEFLTGRPPFSGATVLETLDQVRKTEPVSPSRLNPATPRDLETICLKALQKDPAKRYASCAELADDLRRYSNGEPIKARPVGTLERAVRWCRRNPVVAALGTGIAALLVVGTIASTAAALTIRSKNQELVQKNIDLDKKNIDLDNAATTERGLRSVAEGRLEDKRKLLETMVNEWPELLEGAIYADDVHQAMLKEVEKVRDRAETSDDRHLQLRAETASLLREGRKLMAQRRPKDAIIEFQRARDLAQKVLGDNPPDKDKSAGNLAAALSNLGDAYMMLNDIPKAREYFEKSLAIRREIVRNPQTGELEPAQARAALGASLERLADALINRGLAEEALPVAQEAVAVFAEVKEDLKPDQRQSKAAALRDRGRARLMSGDLPGGRADLDAAIEEANGLVNSVVVNRGYQRYLAFVLDGAAEFELVHKAGDMDRARRFYEKELRIRMDLAEPREVLNCRRELSQTYYVLATTELRAGDGPAARKHYNDCLKLREQLFENDPKNDGLKGEVMLARARCGKVAEAESIASSFEADAREKYNNQPGLKVLMLRRAAFGYALCAFGVAAERAGRLSPELAKKQQAYVDRAIVALEQAVAAGYRNIGQLESDPDFDPIRGDERFRKLVEDLKKKK
jgi:tetratricopeptide (TPR) repeat protein/tRNA A-37 threonylcarbamoyl transferase component Bud32